MERDRILRLRDNGKIEVLGTASDVRASLSELPAVLYREGVAVERQSRAHQRGRSFDALNHLDVFQDPERWPWDAVGFAVVGDRVMFFGDNATSTRWRDVGGGVLLHGPADTRGWFGPGQQLLGNDGEGIVMWDSPTVRYVRSPSEGVTTQLRTRGRIRSDHWSPDGTLHWVESSSDRQQVGYGFLSLGAAQKDVRFDVPTGLIERSVAQGNYANLFPGDYIVLQPEGSGGLSVSVNTIRGGEHFNVAMFHMSRAYWEGVEGLAPMANRLYAVQGQRDQYIDPRSLEFFLLDSYLVMGLDNALMMDGDMAVVDTRSGDLLLTKLLDVSRLEEDARFVFSPYTFESPALRKQVVSVGWREICQGAPKGFAFRGTVDRDGLPSFALNEFRVGSEHYWDELLGRSLDKWPRRSGREKTPIIWTCACKTENGAWFAAKGIRPTEEAEHKGVGVQSTYTLVYVPDSFNPVSEDCLQEASME